MPRKFTSAQERMLLRLLRLGRGVRIAKNAGSPEHRTLESLVRREFAFSLPDLVGFSPGRIVAVYQLTPQGRAAAQELLTRKTAA